MTNNNHIPFPTESELPEDVKQRLSEFPALNIYKLLGNVPSCVIPWTDLIRGLYQGELTPRQREVAILRQAIHDQSEYELFQHDAIARGIGMTQKELDIIFGSETVTQLSDDENLICLAADEVAKLGSLTTETRNTLLNTFGRHVTTEIVLLLSVYCCVARILKSSNIPTEEVSPLEGMESPT